MEFAPAGSAGTLISALPLASMPVATTVEPSRILTVPVGVPELDVTLTVKATVCPYTEGFREEDRFVVVTF